MSACGILDGAARLTAPTPKFDPLAARRKLCTSEPGRGAPLVFNVLPDDRDRNASGEGREVRTPEMAADLSPADDRARTDHRCNVRNAIGRANSMVVVLLTLSARSGLTANRFAGLRADIQNEAPAKPHSLEVLGGIRL